jgi:two-component sensor histidine kinase
MPPENDLHDARTSRQIGGESPVWRTADSYERELAARRATELELRVALARDERLLRRHKLLTAEGDHRLLNNLQMIVGLLSLQSQREANEEVAARLAVAAARVQAIAGLHQHLHSMEGTPTVEFKPYLERLCRGHATMSMSEQRPDQTIVVDAIELRLPTTTGLPLGLIVNELVTNAIKHGSGRITVTLAPAAPGHAAMGYALSVGNEGTLPAGFDLAAAKGLGMTLVSSLAAQIGGELRIDQGDNNDGTRFTVLFA